MNIYITDLQAYNEGTLVGKWLELPLSGFELAQAISEVLSEGETVCQSEDHEELFITDYECDYMEIDEYDSIDELNTIAEVVESYSSDDFLKLKLLESEGFHIRKLILEEGIHSFDVEIHDYSSSTSFTDVYELLAEDMVDEGLFGEIPQNLINYIDYSAIGRDLAYDYTEIEPNVLARSN